jgi:hypothetical protein
MTVKELFNEMLEQIIAGNAEKEISLHIVDSHNFYSGKVKEVFENALGSVTIKGEAR